MDDLPERSAPDPVVPAPISHRRRALSAGAAIARQAAPYAAVAILGTALCFFLHYLGNGLPRELARQRFADAATSAAAGLPRPDLDGVTGIGARTEYCTYALAVLGGSDGGGDPLLDAILLKSWDAGDRHCEAYDAAAGGEELPRTTLKTRYWWGGKALFAVGLRFLSVAEFHQMIRVSMYAAWAAFAVALWLLSRRALAVAAPLIALGVLASGIELFADIGNGLPYAWAVWAAAILALLLRRRDSRAARAAPLFCFAAGMASSYLWLLDGHTILAVPLIGLVAWFGYGRLCPGARARRAVGAVALYAAGFAVCFALGQAVKVAAYEATTSGFDVLGRGPVRTLLSGIDSKLERTVGDSLGIEATEADERRSCWDCEPQGWRRLTIAREYLLGVQPFSVAEARILGAASLLALAAAAAAAGGRAWRGETGIAPDLLWLAGLTALVLPQLLIQDDVPYRVARYVFLPLALCWSCLILVLPELRRAHASLLAGGVLAVALGAWGWQALRAEAALAAFDGVRPVVRADFEVYHSGNRLMYVKPGCGWSDAALLQRISLHAVPAAGAGPPDPELERIGFLFREHQLPLFRRCAAIVDLPGYDIERVVTGQWVWQAPEPAWFEGYRVNRPGADLEAYRVEYASLAGGEPAARSEFDLYLGGGSLTLVRRECTPADTQARVFLHVVPVDPGDLAEASRGRGFDNLDFAFLDRGAWFDGRCMATAGLPSYAVARIRTGQRTEEGDLWSTEIVLAPVEGGPSIEALREARTRLAGREPAARAAFDLHVEGSTLFYVRGECGPDDAAAPFFLHVTPLDAGDLPEERRAAGFDNLDFAFHERGWGFGDGACVAAVELPAYGIASVRTGQWVRGEGTIWRAEFAPGP